MIRLEKVATPLALVSHRHRAAEGAAARGDRGDHSSRRRWLTLLPPESRSWTTAAPLSATPFTAPPGWVVSTPLVARPAPIVTVAEVPV